MIDKAVPYAGCCHGFASDVVLHFTELKKGSAMPLACRWLYERAISADRHRFFDKKQLKSVA